MHLKANAPFLLLPTTDRGPTERAPIARCAKLHLMPKEGYKLYFSAALHLRTGNKKWTRGGSALVVVPTGMCVSYRGTASGHAPTTPTSVLMYDLPKSAVSTSGLRFWMLSFFRGGFTNRARCLLTEKLS
jgi:hypothetical protein